MGARFRSRQAAPDYQPPGNLVQAHNAVDTRPQDNEELLGGTSDKLYVTSDGYSLQSEVQHVMANAHAADYPSRQYSNHDDIDYEVDGRRGQVDGVPYSTGVVSSDLVENFALTGEQANIRRPYSNQADGPVGTSDHNGLLAMAYMQSQNQYYPGEAAQADVVRAV
jgi:hypothetical protein